MFCISSEFDIAAKGKQAEINPIQATIRKNTRKISNASYVTSMPDYWQKKIFCMIYLKLSILHHVAIVQ